MTDLFLRMLDVSITASYIVLGVLLIRLLLKKAPKWITCLLWGIVALRLILPVFPQSDISLIPNEEVLPRNVVTQQAPAAQSAAAQEAVALPAQTAWETYLPIASMVWLAGVAAMLLYSLIAWLRLRHKVQASILQDKNIYACDQVDSPFILGFFRPRIYVPSGMEETVLQSVLAHENAHIRRRDHWWKPFGFLLLSVYWFNPCLWLAYIMLCRDIERACDEKAIAEMDPAEKKNYSQALILCSIPRRMIVACPVAFGEVAIKERIKGILSYKKPTVWIVAVSVLICAATAACFLTNPKTCIHEYGGQLLTTPTCTHQGTERFTCTKCNHSYTKPVNLLEHNYDEGVVTRTSTCSEPGSICFTCTDCGAVKTQVLATNDVHDLKETVTKEATCTQTGEGVLACTRCDHAQALTYPMKDHCFVNGVVLTQSTCAVQGELQQNCTGCGTQRVVSMATNDEHSWRGANGKRYKWCAYCDARISKNGVDLLDTMSGNKTTYADITSVNQTIDWDPTTNINRN